MKDSSGATAVWGSLNTVAILVRILLGWREIANALVKHLGTDLDTFTGHYFRQAVTSVLIRLGK